MNFKATTRFGGYSRSAGGMPFKMNIAFWLASPRPHNANSNMNNRPSLDIHNLVIQPHLPFSFKEDVDLLELTVAVPVAGLFTGFVCRGSKPDDFAIEFMVHNSSALLIGGFNKSAKVVSPAR